MVLYRSPEQTDLHTYISVEVSAKFTALNFIALHPHPPPTPHSSHVFKKYIDRDSSFVTPISVVSSVPQEQSEMNSEDMNITKSDPASSKLQNSDILKGSRPETFTPRSSPKKGTEIVYSSI